MALLIATMNQICMELTDFMTAMKNELKKSNESQLKLLNVQKHYQDKLDNEVRKVIQNVLNMTVEKQNKLFAEVLENFQKSTNKLVKAVDDSADVCRRTANHADKTAKKLFKAESWRDLMYYAAPGAVLLNLIFRVWQHFAGG